MSYSEVSELEAERANELDLATTAVEAQEMLVAMQVAEYPYLKKNPRKAFYKKIHNLAFGYNRSKKKASSVEDFVQSFVRDQKSGRR